MPAQSALPPQAQGSPGDDSASDSSRDTAPYGKAEDVAVKQESVKQEPESLHDGASSSIAVKQDPGADVKQEPEQPGQELGASGAGNAGALAGLGSYASDSEGSEGAAPDADHTLGFF